VGERFVHMNLFETSIAGVCVVESTVFQDKRGAFSRLFCTNELQPILGQRVIVQINHSVTHRVGAVRGLHYQHPPHGEMKIVRCLKGRVFDVAVDLRQGSPTFMNWTSVELTPESHRALVIPEGCAHGFQVLEASSELLYLHTAFYTPSAEGTVRFDERRIAVDWPLAPADMSTKDLSYPHLGESFTGIVL
jgi:dTDP-4-dehydrorhamnose 3,5-epimerase